MSVEHRSLTLLSDEAKFVEVDGIAASDEAKFVVALARVSVDVEVDVVPSFTLSSDVAKLFFAVDGLALGKRFLTACNRGLERRVAT